MTLPLTDRSGAPRKRFRRLRDLPARTALRVTNLPPVARLLGNRYRTAVSRHRPKLPTLGGLDAEVVRGLHRRGIFVTSLAALALPDGDEMVRRAASMAEAFGPEARTRVRDGADLNMVPAAALLAEPMVFRWGLGGRLLAIAEAYLGLPIGYDGVSINYTVADGRAVSTRRWHRDWEDRRMLKVAVYLNDVDAAGGPFEMICRPVGGQDEATGFHYAIATDEELPALLGEDFADDLVSCEGEAGTVVFSDTARFFHRGKPATARDRMAAFFSYFSRPPRHPFFCERSGLSRRDIRALAKGLDPTQLAAVFWRKTVPLPLRLIPPARV